MAQKEIMLAVWPNANQREYWSGSDTCRSMWLSLREVTLDRDEDGDRTIEMEHYGFEARGASDSGLYVWSSKGFSCSVDLNAHSIHSSKIYDLEQLVKWMKKYQKKIDKADIPRSFGVKETVILTLRAMGIKNALWIDPDWQSKPRYKVIGIEEALALPNYASAIEEMERARLVPYESA